MEVLPDFKELLKLFNTNKVIYIVVGGYALAFYGAPRYTGDIDLFVKPDKDNASCILRALDQFGFGSLGLKREDFFKPKNVIQLGDPPVRIDLVTSISGVSWKDAYEGRVNGNYGDIPVNFIGKDHLILNKKALGRKRDLADLEALGEE